MAKMVKDIGENIIVDPLPLEDCLLLPESWNYVASGEKL
jgi:hypothetical protein